MEMQPCVFQSMRSNEIVKCGYKIEDVQGLRGLRFPKLRSWEMKNQREMEEARSSKRKTGLIQNPETKQRASFIIQVTSRAKGSFSDSAPASAWAPGDGQHCSA